MVNKVYKVTSEAENKTGSKHIQVLMSIISKYNSLFNIFLHRNKIHIIQGLVGSKTSFKSYKQRKNKRKTGIAES